MAVDTQAPAVPGAVDEVAKWSATSNTFSRSI